LTTKSAKDAKTATHSKSKKGGGLIGPPRKDRAARLGDLGGLGGFPLRVFEVFVSEDDGGLSASSAFSAVL